MIKESVSKKHSLMRTLMFVFGVLAMFPFTIHATDYGNCYVSISANSTVYDAGYYEWHSFPSGCPSGSVASSGTLTGDATRGRVFCSTGNISASYAAYTKTYSNGCICHQVSCAGGQSVSISGGGGSVHYSSSSQARSSSSVRSSSSARSSSSTKISDIIVKNGSDNNKVTSNKSSAKTGDVVTLTVSHEKGYLLYDLTIKDESDHEINPNGCLWYYSGNTCTFEMPSSKVTITPKFTSKLNADGGLFINMPKSGTLTVDVPDDVSSFNVYDDGGVNGDYSNYCAGYLKLKTNTDSDKFSLNGSVYTEKGYDYFYVYDGLSTDDKMLIEKMDGTNNPINAVTSSHNKMMLKFSSDGGIFKSGLALTAAVIRNLNSENITVADIPAQTYTGSAICPVVSVNYKGSELKAGTDYTVTCPYNVNPGTGSITITGKGNYAGSISKTFEILKAPLTVTAKNNTITYGDEPSNAGVEYEGFVNGETENVLNGELSYSYDYAKFGNVGEYAITPSGLTAGNYEIKYVAGKLKVEPKIISIAWGEQTVFTYDGEEHAPTATADGLLNNDECELAVTGAAVNPGNYTATVTGLSNTNYKLPENGTEKEFKIVKPIAYIDENGDEQTVTKYTVLTNDISVDELSGGWYVVEGNVKYVRMVKFNGDVNLILADGAKLEIDETEGEKGILTNANLIIYGQSKQSGTLKVSSKGNYGIYSSVNITINGGSVTASGSKYGIGSEQGNITISGGTVEAKATGTIGYGIYGYHGVTISGGSVTASGDDYGIFSREGNITLGWTNSTDFIKASSYYCKKGSVFIAEGKSFKDDKGYVYRGTLNAGQLSSLKGQKLEPFEGVSVSFVDNFSGASDVFAEIAVDGEGHVSAPSKLPFHSGNTFVGWFTAKDGNTEFDFSAPITGNTTVYAKWKENTPVEYIDENGKANSVTDYVLLTNDINVDNLPGGWYVVQGEVKYTSQVKFSGDAHLILADGAKMEIETEGEVEEGILTNGNLTIYGQSMQSGILNVASTGRMGFGIMACNDITINGGTVEATGNGFGIYVNNDVSINGGTITAASNDNNGIYSGRNVTISDGTVTATGNYNGIYSNGTVTISGGTVEAKATGGNYGIYGSNGVTISGGTVKAIGSKYGISCSRGVTISGGTVTATGEYGIYSYNGNITLGWTNSTDFIKANSYYSKNGVSITEGKSLKDEKGNVYSGTLTEEQLSAIKGNKLEPCYAVALDLQDGKAPVMLPATFDENGVAHVAEPENPTRDGFVFLGWFTTVDGDTEFDWTAAVTQNTTIYAKWENTPVAYIDEKGVRQIVTKYTVLTNDISVDNLPGGWYVVQGEVKYTSQVKFSGDAHLILADEANMAIETEGREGIYASNNLTIYGQSGQSGFLIVTAIGDYGCGIYSNGDITISGGTVTASNTSSIDAPICSKGDIKISGGKVSAYGNDYGIYSYNGITISGGTVTAYGNDYGIYSYNGITLSWTNSTDFVKASSYFSKYGSVQIAEGKFFKDEKGNVYSGPLSDDDLESIKNKTLVPSFNGTYLSDVNIAVADIPVQKYADGKPVCPSVLVTDGKDTLKAGTDYTVTCVNNTAVTSATLDEAAVAQITGKGNYAGVIQKSFFIWKNVGNYAAVQVFEDADGKTHAEIDGAYDGADAVNIDEEIADVAAKFNRKFPKGKYSTTVLPFDVNTANVEGLDVVLGYNGIKTVNGKSSIRMKVLWATDEWVKTNNIMDDDGDYKRYPDVNLTANTPYLVQMGDATTFYVKGAVTLKATGPTDISIDGWTFRGTWKYKKWGPSCSTEGQNCDRETGNAYGFAASSSDDDKINVGDFVRVGEGAWIRPMRAYLVSTKILESTSPAQGVRANGNYVMRPSFAQEELPEFMSIVIDVDDEGKETTVIGQFNTRTGEIKMNYDRGKFDLKGRRVDGKNNARGAYYGKKVLKK